MTELIVAFLAGELLGAAVVLCVFAASDRWRIVQVTVAPQDIARGIVAGGGIQCTVPPVYVDWSIIHKIVEAEGYMLIAKHTAAAPRQQ